MTREELCKAALDAAKTAYAPYSHYSVGAALLAKSGNVYIGCNIENASYTPTVCAERVAFFKAVSEGEREFAEIAVAGGYEGDCEGFFMPCGVCRQVMTEFCGRDFTVTVARADGAYVSYSLDELLPHSFSKDDMGK